MENKNYIPALRFNWLTKLYDPLIRYFMPEKEFKSELIKQAAFAQNYNVLDFGCGTLTLSLLAKQTHPYIAITGIDVDEKIISIAKEKQKKSGVDITIEKYDGVTLPYLNSSFDRIITSLVFHHLNIEQKKNILKEMHRILKPDGELHIADWGKPSNYFQRLLFYPVQWLDGFETTNDSVSEKLPEYLANASFSTIKNTNHYNTILGTLRLYKGVKSE